MSTFRGWDDCQLYTYRLSDVDEVEVSRAAASQTELASYSDSCSNWTLSCHRLSDDDDGYDVIVDDSDDSDDVVDDSFAKREVSDGVYLQGKNYVIHTRALQGFSRWSLYKSSYVYLYLLASCWINSDVLGRKTHIQTRRFISQANLQRLTGFPLESPSPCLTPSDRVLHKQENGRWWRVIVKLIVKNNFIDDHDGIDGYCKKTLNLHIGSINNCKVEPMFCFTIYSRCACIHIRHCLQEPEPLFVESLWNLLKRLGLSRIALSGHLCCFYCLQVHLKPMFYCYLLQTVRYCVDVCVVCLYLAGEMQTSTDQWTIVVQTCWQQDRCRWSDGHSEETDADLRVAGTTWPAGATSIHDQCWYITAHWDELSVWQL